MRVDRIKRWQWILIGLLIGLVLAYLQSSIGAEGFVFSGKHSSVGQQEFERAIAQPPAGGNPIVKNLRVYPDGNKFLVEFSYLERSDDPKNPLKKGYRDSVLTTEVPFQPVADLTKTVNVGIHPATPRRLLMPPGVVKVNMWPRPAPAQFIGWKPGDNDASDPGTDGQVVLPLRAADYQLTLTAPRANAAQIAQLTIKLNDRALPALTAAPSVTGMPLWKTTVPRSAFVNADRQVLHLSRGTAPIAIHEIRLLDPTYTVVDYLREMALQHPQAAYHVGWWTQPKASLALWTLGSMVLIGGVWPTVIRVMIGAPPPEPAPQPQVELQPSVDLKPPVKPAPTLALSDDEDELELVGASIGDNDHAVTATASVPKLSSLPLEQPVAAMAGSSKADKKDFKGAYYPVRRRQSEGFSLVELLVVIGIIALLLAILMPSLARARQEAQRVQCMSNMRQVGMSLLNYSNAWKGTMFPPQLGDSQPVTNRWPVFVFDPPVYNPPIMNCPSDMEPMAEHTYICNSHLTEHHVTYSNTQAFGVTPSEVIVMGEKTSTVGDYYMDSVAGDYTTKVDFYKHGPQIGSNYLYLDLHVETDTPKTSMSDIDPWDPTVPAAP